MLSQTRHSMLFLIPIHDSPSLPKSMDCSYFASAMIMLIDTSAAFMFKVCSMTVPHAPSPLKSARSLKSLSFRPNRHIGRFSACLAFAEIVTNMRSLATRPRRQKGYNLTPLGGGRIYVVAALTKYTI